MLKSLDSISLLLKDNKNKSLKKLVALQSNYLSKVEDLNYNQ